MVGKLWEVLVGGGEVKPRFLSSEGKDSQEYTSVVPGVYIGDIVLLQGERDMRVRPILKNMVGVVESEASRWRLKQTARPFLLRPRH